MEVEKRDGKIQRKILIAMITSKEVIGRISSKWTKEGLFESKWCNIIGGWCVRHYLKYDKCLGKSIQHRFDHWAEHGEKETVKLVDRFLSSLSTEYDQNGDLNSEYITDIAGEYFNRAAALRLNREVEQEIDRGKTREALSKINSFSEIDLGQGGTVDVLTDEEAIRRTFAEKKEPIIHFPGALGRFFGHSLTRDAFISFVGPEKSGKSFFLLDMAWRGMLQRKNVAMFVIGDMSEGQVMERFMERATRRPARKTRKNEPVLYPKSIEHDPKLLLPTMDFSEREYADDLDWREALKACNAVMLDEVKSKKSKLKLKCFPGGTISALGIKSELDAFVRGGFDPAITIIDYADNLAPIDGRVIDTRHQINATWQSLRSISQIFHCLLVTATQANAKAYSTYTLGPQNFSESKMKNAQVTGMIGINQTDDEKEIDVTRLNWIERRGEAFNRRKCVFVAGCRSVANIAVRSCW